MDNYDKYIGQFLDNRYELLEIVGTGGMAVVYKARCHRLNRLVAVKILKDELAVDAEFRRRFHTESQAVAMLSHPNIVSVYDVSRSAEVEYIVMELIDGITLKQYLKKIGTLNWREALHYTTQIVSALSHAHSRGIIHRDIKPHNIMILRDGSVKVADFGIARVATSQNTLTQEALGSVHYISPEQAKGGNVDERSDLYSVGVVMYEMLTGRLPFEGDSAVSVAIQHISSIPLSPRELNPDIPVGLETITMRAMASDIDRRYPSADALLTDLEEFRKNPDHDFSYVSPLTEEEIEPTRRLGAVMPLNTGKPAAAARLEKQKSTQGKGQGQSQGQGRATTAADEREEYRRRKKRSSRVAILAGTLAVLLIVLGMVYFLYTSFFADLLTQTEKIAVPNLVGRSAEEVIAEYAGGEEFVIVLAGEEPSAEYEAGLIIEQSPTASGGRTAARGSEIKITVSSGEEYLLMPTLINTEYRTAISTLVTMGLDYETDFVTSDVITENYVISQTPLANTKIEEGIVVYLVISTGPEAKTTIMPDLFGMTISEAKEKLESSNLILGDYPETYSDEPAGTVVFQNVTAGREVMEKTTINVQISKGPINQQDDPDESGDPGETGETGDPDGGGGSSEPDATDDGGTGGNDDTGADDQGGVVVGPPEVSDSNTDYE